MGIWWQLTTGLIIINLTKGERDSLSLTLNEFKDRKIYDSYTPLTCFDIDSLLRIYSDVYLVTDKISDPILIERFFSKYKDRLCIECFSFEDYHDLTELGYYLPMLSGVSTNEMLWKQRLKKYLTNWTYIVPDFFATEASKYCKMAEEDNASIINRFSLELSSYALFSCKNRREADSIFKKHPEVRLIYIDDVNMPMEE